MRLESLLKHERAVPRYTSYPTAAQFHAQIGAAERAAWLAELPDGETVALYLHVPFCRSLCWYCACHTRVARGQDQLDRYAEAVIGELEMVARAIGRRARVAAVQWGGGTPTELGPQLFQRVMARARQLFDLAPQAEISVETDPRYFDVAMARALAASGVNRVSLGVQDFDETVQAAINRRQSVATTAAAIAALRSCDIERINLDLVYGLPHQTLASLAATLAAAIALRPSRFAVFGYAHVPWMKRHQKLIDEAALPGLAERLAMAQLVARRLTEEGYRAIGLDHFALPGDSLDRAAGTGALRRNFQGYTDVPARFVIGLGASAISELPGGFVQNPVAVAQYRAAVAKGMLPAERGVAVHPSDRRIGEIIERLMCGFHVDLADIAARHGVPVSIFAEELTKLKRLERDGLVELDGATIRVPEPAHPAVRLVCAVFDRYLGEAATARHSRAV